MMVLYRDKLMPHLTDDQLEQYLRNKYENELMSLSAIASECGIDYRTVHKYFDKFGIKKRSKSEGMKLRFAKMSDKERKEHMKSAHSAVREKEWSEEDLHKMARSRVRAKMSKWEKWFAKKLIDNDLYYFMYSYPVGRYSIDFAFPTYKIAIEIDTRWHTKKDTAKKDNNKDNWLQSNGWQVIRLEISSYFLVKEDMPVYERNGFRVIHELKERLR